MIESNSLSDFRETHGNEVMDSVTNLKDIIELCLSTSETPDTNCTRSYAFLNWNFNVPDFTEELESKYSVNLQNNYESFHQLGYGYLNAAYVLLKYYLSNNPTYDADLVIFPIFFNIQQGLELYLKSFLIHNNSKRMYEDKELWERFKNCLTESEQQIVEDVDNLIIASLDDIVNEVSEYGHNVKKLFDSFERVNNCDVAKKYVEVVRAFVYKYSDFVNKITKDDTSSHLIKTQEFWEKFKMTRDKDLDGFSSSSVEKISKSLTKLVNNHYKVDYMWMRYTHTNKGVVQYYANSLRNICVNLKDVFIILVILYDALEHIYDGVIYMD